MINETETIQQVVERSETDLGHPVISRTRLREVIKELQENDGKIVENVDKRKTVSLLSEDEVTFLEEVIIERDRANNGMTRNEVILFIQYLSGSTNVKAKNHFNWLIKSKKLSKLKRGGKTVKAQNTTTARSQIRVESQLRWHCMMDGIWEGIKNYNRLPANDKRRPFEEVMEYFWLNLDETCIRCDDGNLRVLGASDKRITSKCNSDSKFSITILRVGSAAGVDGPIIFLVEGKKIDSDVLKDLPKKFGCPIGSCVIATPSAYMMDKAWDKLLPKLIEGIRAMKGIKDYPEFKSLLGFDG